MTTYVEDFAMMVWLNGFALRTELVKAYAVGRVRYHRWKSCPDRGKIGTTEKCYRPMHHKSHFGTNVSLILPW